MRYIFGLIALALTFAVMAHTVSIEYPQGFRRSDFSLVESKSEIPSIVLMRFSSLCGNCTLADIGQPFNATDLVGEDDLPARRLLAAGVHDRLWFIAYEHGGRGHHSHFVMFKIDDNGVSCVLANGRAPKGCHSNSETKSEVGSTCGW